MHSYANNLNTIHSLKDYLSDLVRGESSCIFGCLAQKTKLNYDLYYYIVHYLLDVIKCNNMGMRNAHHILKYFD